jgi:hypothetical protein
MSKQKLIVIFALFAITVLGIAGCQKHGNNSELSQHSTDAATAIDAKPSGSTQAEPTAEPVNEAPSPPPLSNMMSDAGFKRVLSHIANGDEIKDTPEYQLFLEQASRDPNAALARIKHALDASPAYDTMARVYIFDAMLEIAHTLNSIDTKKVDAYLASALPTIEQQLSAPIYVAMPKQNYTPKELEQMAHNDLYFYENGILYANTYRAQHMAVAVLGEAATPYTLEVLAKIANTSSFDNRIRQVAGMGVRQVKR